MENYYDSVAKLKKIFSLRLFRIIMTLLEDKVSCGIYGYTLEKYDFMG